MWRRTRPQVFVGNTPAYAGKTSPVRSTFRACRKHPRLRGEDGRRCATRSMTAETPPLTRGRPGTSCRGPARTQKHPRLRGEDAVAQLQGGGVQETPPLTRGRPARRSRPRDRRGNTPAYAGKTHPCSADRGVGWKHPRLRGEDAELLFAGAQDLETPPLTRGRRRRRQARVEDGGNTPAYAGKTAPRATSSAR